MALTFPVPSTQQILQTCLSAAKRRRSSSSEKAPTSRRAKARSSRTSTHASPSRQLSRALSVPTAVIAARRRKWQTNDYQRRRDSHEAPRHCAPRRTSTRRHCEITGRRGGDGTTSVGGSGGRDPEGGQGVRRGGRPEKSEHNGGEQGQGDRGQHEREQPEGNAAETRRHGHVLETDPPQLRLFHEDGGGCRAHSGPERPEQQAYWCQEGYRWCAPGLALRQRCGFQEDILVRRFRAAAQVFQEPEDCLLERGAGTEG
ncbi:hypothetical protein EPUL_004919 [Erysiphe pulchra]|uniref:Uncharacterized protein n=1 Tax=Erysiphe pulchra TaxID=225359 RepID=A0A2S4PIG3_9PEZI|nr:hypothetical protein EPUL_004919 [Erysiphe pulchra]